MIDKIMTLIGPASEDQEEYLEVLLEIDKLKAKTYTNQPEEAFDEDDGDEELLTIVMLMVVEDFNKRNLEGVTSISTSGLSEGLVDGYSHGLISLLNSKRKLVVR